MTDDHLTTEERRVRRWLHARVDGPDTTPAPVVESEPDWWDRLYEDDEQTPAELPPAADEPGGWWQAQPDYYQHIPRPHWPAVPAPVQRALSPKTRALLFNATAAGTGWLFGLVPLCRGWLADCGTNFSIAGALVLGIGGCALIAHVWDRRTRHWWWGIAWVARIPLASGLLALGLYAPGTI